MAKTRKKPRRGWGRFIVYLILICLGLIIGGFIAFSRYVDRLATPTTIAPANGIVVWTGKGGDRLMAAGILLREGKGERLLISGVNEATTEADIYKLLAVSEKQGACCVDLDYKAVDTIGNARETYQWMESLGYSHVILVTSDYHMPRAITEIRSLSGRVRVTPYPVEEVGDEPWWQDGTRRRRMVSEYGKLLLSYLRNAGGSAEREAPELEMGRVGPDG